MTVPLEDNASSHFRPVIDSRRVLRPLLAFSASSFAAFGIDTLAPMVLTRLTGILWVSVLAATGAPEALIGTRDPGALEVPCRVSTGGP